MAPGFTVVWPLFSYVLPGVAAVPHGPGEVAHLPACRPAFAAGAVVPLRFGMVHDGMDSFLALVYSCALGVFSSLGYLGNLQTIKKIRFEIITKILLENNLQKIYRDKNSYMIIYKDTSGKRIRLTIPLNVLGFTYRNRLKKIIDSLNIDIVDIYDIDFKVRA